MQVPLTICFRTSYVLIAMGRIVSKYPRSRSNRWKFTDQAKKVQISQEKATFSPVKTSIIIRSDYISGCRECRDNLRS